MSMQTKKLAQESAHVFRCFYNHDIHTMPPPFFPLRAVCFSICPKKTDDTKPGSSRRNCPVFYRIYQRFQSGMALAC